MQFLQQHDAVFTKRRKKHGIFEKSKNVLSVLFCFPPKVRALAVRHSYRLLFKPSGITEEIFDAVPNVM